MVTAPWSEVLVPLLIRDCALPRAGPRTPETFQH